ncbi:MAG TPA: ABC-F family ATP-binding cassette domain-containing protein [Candidatus Cloacimonadota bacterium]|nr:ABC-F family ATP-binding cassette domain-containing protein [Candidatus Cloacimonadota bacterium]
MANEVILTLENINLSYGDKCIIKDANFGIHYCDKIGVLGINGSGKTTLLKVLSGVLKPNSGSITPRKNLKIGYLEQDPSFYPGSTVLEHVLPADPKDQKEEHVYKSLLTKMGIETYNKPMHLLSGGQRRKVDIAKVLACEPDLLVMDEPTNHLDLDTIEWLQDYLATMKTSLIFVTHDRYFLDSVCNRIFEIERTKLYFYEGNYSDYVKGKILRQQDSQRKETRRQAQLDKELAWLARGSRARATKPKNHVDRVKELLSKSYLIEEQDLDISFQTDRLGRTILELHKLSKSYDSRPLFEELDHNFQPLERIGILGPNGCGKTTLLKMITGEVKPDIGSIKLGINTHIAYYKQDEDSFDPKLSVYEYIAQYAETIRMADGSKVTATEMLNRFLFDGKMQQMKLSALSGGERKRLYLLKSLMFGANFIILDEPTNDLDIRTLEILEDYLDAFRGCLLVVSHDRFFLDRCVDYLFIHQNGRFRKFAGNYSDYLLVKRYEKEEREEAANPEILRPKRTNKGLSYNEQREFAGLESRIRELETKLNELEERLSLPNLKVQEYSELATEIEILSSEHETILERWVELSDKASL